MKFFSCTKFTEKEKVSAGAITAPSLLLEGEFPLFRTLLFQAVDNHPGATTQREKHATPFLKSVFSEQAM